MLNEEAPAPSIFVDPRKRHILEAARSVFMLHGYRKTSMESVAQAAGISRQGIYRHFSSKENLYMEMGRHLLDRAIESATAAFTTPEVPVRQRLVRAFDEWMGQFVEDIGPNLSELLHFSRILFGPLIGERQARFSMLVAGLLAGSERIGNYEGRGITARQLANVLYATAEGFMSRGGSRKKFVENMTFAVKTVCVLLDERSSDGSPGGLESSDGFQEVKSIGSGKRPESS
jgi:TetR/AcrR family transcriptional regulator of autoinduction and epiphytic fitness